MFQSLQRLVQLRVEHFRFKLSMIRKGVGQLCGGELLLEGYEFALVIVTSIRPCLAVNGSSSGPLLAGL
jgi:hypothetical protein